MKSCIAATVLCLATGAIAQGTSTTVGELLAKGGKQLTKEEITALYADGVTSSGILASNAARRSDSTFNRDGTMSGTTALLTGDGSFGFTGRWAINDHAQQCVYNVRSSTNGRDVTPSPNCYWIYKVGDNYYTSVGDTPDAAAQARAFKK